MQRKLILPLVLALASGTVFGSEVSAAGASSTLTITQATQIPGDTLKAGEYSITIVDQLADRMIVRIDSKTTAHHDIFLGVQGTGETEAAGPVMWQSGLHKTPALRGFNFANGSRLEFVYPKAEAAALAQENSSKVVAIDPQSEGRAALKNLSKDEMQVVNLWMLSLTTAGVDNKTPAILAQRYEPRPDIHPAVAASSPESKPQPDAQPQVASVERPALISASERTNNGSPRPGRSKAVMAQLPHTGSSLSLVWVAALLSLLFAMLLRGIRKLVERGIVA